MSTRFSLLTCLNDRDLTVLKGLLEQEKFALLEIDGTAVHDSRSFFLQVRDRLPLDPPLVGAVNWDALSDSLSAGVMGLPEARVALIWTEAQNMLDGGLPHLLDAVDTLFGVARSVYSPSSEVVSPKEMLVFLVGRGANFPALVSASSDSREPTR